MWRIVKEEKSLWFEVLNFRFDLDNSGFMNHLSSTAGLSSSVWWRDLCSIEGGIFVPQGWFKDGLNIKVGEGRPTSFWHDSWIRYESLKSMFPRLYSISINQFAKVSRVGRWEGNSWI